MRFTVEAIGAARRDVGSTGDAFVEASRFPEVALTDMPAAQRSMDRLDDAVDERLVADADVFNALVEALGAIWTVISGADEELAAFLADSQVLE